MKFFAFVAVFAFLAAAAHAAPWVGAGLVGEQTVVAGPSGTIATGRTLAAPVVSSYAAPVVSSYAAAPLVSSYAAPIVSAYGAPGLVARTIW